VIKSRRMRWAGHVARMGEERWVYRVVVGKQEGKNHCGNLGVDGLILFGWISRRWDVGIWTGLSCTMIETYGGSCECGNEPSGFVKCGEFLTSCKPVSFSRRTLHHGVSKQLIK